MFDRGKMFCTLTCHIINRNLVNVSNHVAGRRYRLAKGTHCTCQLTKSCFLELAGNTSEVFLSAESHAKGELELFVEPDEVSVHRHSSLARVGDLQYDDAWWLGSLKARRATEWMRMSRVPNHAW